MEPELSAPILAQTAKAWRMLNVPHEEIMCLNNAAVQYICLQNYDNAENILKEAIERSLSIDNFGYVYLNNNMGLIHMFRGNKKLAVRNFLEAKKGKFRFVEQLIVDINLSVFHYLEKGVVATYPTLKELYTKAVTVGEYAYIIPTVINLGLAKIEMGDTDEGIKLLESIQKPIKTHNAFETHIWYKTLYKYYNETDTTKMEDLEKNFGKTVNSYAECQSDCPQMAYVTMEYWSDN
jgi:tetratricopeptide (TPR) repeat protein